MRLGRGVPYYHDNDDKFEVVVIGIGQVEHALIIVLSAPDKTIVVVVSDIAWRAWKTNKILTQYGIRY